MNQLLQQFPSLVNQIVQSSNQVELNCYSTIQQCPNQFVGIVRINNDDVRWINEWVLTRQQNGYEELIKRNIAADHDLKILELVLESPHKNEYKNGNPIGPAMGDTGKYIKEQLSERLGLYQKTNVDDRISNGDYLVLLTNAVPFQTSLGLDTKIVRDRLWISSWINGGRKDFIETLKLQSPNVVINVCTQGNHENDGLFMAYMRKKNKQKIRFKNGESVAIGQKFLSYVDPNLFVEDASQDHFYVSYLGERIYDSSYIITSSLYQNKCTLHGFVQNAIMEYCTLVGEQNSPICLFDYHPSSWKWKN